MVLCWTGPLILSLPALFPSFSPNPNKHFPGQNISLLTFWDCRRQTLYGILRQSPKKGEKRRCSNVPRWIFYGTSTWANAVASPVLWFPQSEIQHCISGCLPDWRGEKISTWYERVWSEISMRYRELSASIWRTCPPSHNTSHPTPSCSLLRMGYSFKKAARTLRRICLRLTKS